MAAGAGPIAEVSEADKPLIEHATDDATDRHRYHSGACHPEQEDDLCGAVSTTR
jgi:hypothetical protein